VKLRVALCFIGGLALASGLGLAWALHFPSSRMDNIFFGGLLIPPAWVGAMLWLWFGTWKQLCLRLVAAGSVMAGAVLLGFHFG
jgi:hypothetical protein